MAAFIAGLVSFVVGGSMYVSMEGTLTGSFALACVCIWNGFFNSIQVVCRERAIVKREHRSGLHISSYVIAHLIYQAFLCICQAILTIVVLNIAEVTMPAMGFVTGNIYLDLGITLFLITYAADVMALMVSSLVHSTTTAMTVMPFLLIIQLVFAGTFFPLSGPVALLSNLTIAKWGTNCLCALGDYNRLPMVSIWNNLVKLKDIEYQGEKPLRDILVYLEENGYRDQILLESAKYNQNVDYARTMSNIGMSWIALGLFILVCTAIAVLSLELIDRDRR